MECKWAECAPPLSLLVVEARWAERERERGEGRVVVVVGQ